MLPPYFIFASRLRPLGPPTGGPLSQLRANPENLNPRFPTSRRDHGFRLRLSRRKVGIYEKGKAFPQSLCYLHFHCTTKFDFLQDVRYVNEFDGKRGKLFFNNLTQIFNPNRFRVVMTKSGDSHIHFLSQSGMAFF